MANGDTFLGIDVTTGEKPFAYAVVSGSYVVGTPNERITGIREIGWIEPSVPGCVSLINRVKPEVLAIDCPTGLPQGLNLACCFTPQPTCNCAITGQWNGNPQIGRIAEHAVTADGISLYYTNKNSPPYWKRLVNLLWPLWGQLPKLGLTLGNNAIETYPYGVWRRLFPNSPFSWSNGVKNDSYDAVLCAVAAERHSQGRTQPFGIPQEGQIVLPT